MWSHSGSSSLASLVVRIGAVSLNYRDKVVAEFPKTLTNHTVPDIETMLMAA